MDFAEMMNRMADDIERRVIPNMATKQAMTEAGAKVMADQLRAATPRSNHQDVKYGHLRDNVTYQATDIDGEKNGNSVVGFGKKAYVARFLNDGTVKMKGNHFVDNVRKSSSEDVFNAERKAYDEQLGGD